MGKGSARNPKGNILVNSATPSAPTVYSAPTVPTVAPTVQHSAIATNVTPIATVVVSAPVTPTVKKGNSSVANPVATVWVTCANMCFTPTGAPVATTPTRAQLHNACSAMGVAYYTTRTQVQAFLRASVGGTVVPTVTPKYVVFNFNTL
jgi:hypothetical protein